MIRHPLTSTLFPYTTLFRSVYGFTMMLLKVLEDERPDVILLAFEGGRTFRHETFTEYKSHRPRTPDDLAVQTDRKSTRLNSSHITISYAVFCLKKKKKT